MKINRLAAGLLAGTLALAGCAGTSTDDEGGDPGSSGELTAVPGFDPEEGVIRVGTVLPLSGPLSTAGLGVQAGIESYFGRINAGGGIAGKYQVELVPGDSEYDPQQAISAYNDLIDEVVMFGPVLGTAIVGAVLPQAQADDALMMMSPDTSAYLREPNILIIRPTFEPLVVNGLAYLVENGAEDKTMCLILQDDAFGESVKTATDFAVEELGLTLEEEVRYPLANTDFTPQISQLKSAGCELVVYGGGLQSSIPLMTSAVQLDFAPQWLVLPTAFGQNLLASPVVDYLVENWTMSSTGAEWGDTSVPGMAQLLEDFEEYAPEGTVAQPNVNLAGYQYGMTIEALLTEAVERGDLSHKSLVDVSQSGIEVDFKGLGPNVELAPADERTPPTPVTIFAVDPAVEGGQRAIETDYDSEAGQAISYD